MRPCLLDPEEIKALKPQRVYLSMSFTNSFAGGCVVEAYSLGHAVAVARDAGLIPEDAQVMVMLDENSSLPLNQLLSKEDLRRLAPGQFVRERTGEVLA